MVTTTTSSSNVNAESETPGGSSVDGTMEDRSPATTRRRSLSVASEQPSVETVVVKAKRAAKSLWTLLHAKNCTNVTCTHDGCQRAKLINLHLKTCPLSSSGGHSTNAVDKCPTGYPGCEEARKLMAHYHRCRSMRARQAGNPDARRGQYQCLVCTLVARQARTVLENGPPRQLSPHPSSGVSSKPKHTVTSFSVRGGSRGSADDATAPPKSAEKMPPPRPRRLEPLDESKQFLVSPCGDASNADRNAAAPQDDDERSMPPPPPSFPRSTDSDFRRPRSISIAETPTSTPNGKKLKVCAASPPGTTSQLLRRQRSASVPNANDPILGGVSCVPHSIETISEEGSLASRESADRDLNADLT